MGVYSSDAQRRWFHTKTARAKGITAAEVAKRDAASKGINLPEHAPAIKLKAKVRIKKKGRKA